MSFFPSPRNASGSRWFSSLLADEALNTVAKQRVLIIKPIRRMIKPCAWYCFSAPDITTKALNMERRPLKGLLLQPACSVTSFTRNHAAFLCTIEWFIKEANSVCENNYDRLTVKKLIGAIWLWSVAYLSYSCTHLSSSDYCYVFNHNIPDGWGGKTSA